MEAVRAQIVFLTHEQGGRTRPPGAGTYTCTSTLAGDTRIWSVRLELMDGGPRRRGTLQFIVDCAPHDTLVEGVTLTLLEGVRTVGTVTILAPDPPWRWEGDIDRRMNIELHSLSRYPPMGLDNDACDALEDQRYVRCTTRRGPWQTSRYTLTDTGRRRRNETTDGCTVKHCPCKKAMSSV